MCEIEWGSCMQGRLQVDPIGDRGRQSRLRWMHVEGRPPGTFEPTVRVGPMLVAGRWTDRLHTAAVVAITVQSSAVRQSRRQNFAYFYLLNNNFPFFLFIYKSLLCSLLAPVAFHYLSYSSPSVDTCGFATFLPSTSLSSSHSLPVRASHC
jgi:hypothetical protein